MTNRRIGYRGAAHAAALAAAAGMVVTPTLASASCGASYPITTAPATVRTTDSDYNAACYTTGPVITTDGKRILPNLGGIKPSLIAGRLYLSGGGSDTHMYSGAANNCHLYVVPANATKPPAKPKLFVFIGGTNSTPQSYQSLLQAAGNDGYYGVSLSYPDSDAVGAYCDSFEGDNKTNEWNQGIDPPLPGTSAYKNCSEDMRREIIEGYPAVNAHGTNVDSMGTVVDVPNSIRQRLTDFLQDRANQNKLDSKVKVGDGWAQFLTTSGDVDWSKVVVAGHSQGSGHALYIAKTYSVSRIVEFSGVSDRATDDHSTPAPWLTYVSDSSDPSYWSTKPGSMYAFVEDQDYFVNSQYTGPYKPAPCPQRNDVPVTHHENDSLSYNNYYDGCHWSYDGWTKSQLAGDVGGNGSTHVFTAYNKPMINLDATECRGPHLGEHNATVVDFFTPINSTSSSAAPDTDKSANALYRKIWDMIAFGK